MSQTSASLVLPADRELFDAAEFCDGMELLESKEGQRGRFTSEHVARNQRRYTSIVRALGQNMSVRQICAAFGVSHHTVKAIREREPELIATEKQRFSGLLGHTARMCIESFAEGVAAGKVPLTSLPISAAVLLDKKLLLDGAATSRVEHVRDHRFTVESVFADLRRVESTDCQSGAGVADSKEMRAIGTNGSSEGTSLDGPDLGAGGPGGGGRTGIGGGAEPMGSPESTESQKTSL